MRKHAAKAKAALHRTSVYVSLWRAVIYDNLRYCRSALVGWVAYRPEVAHFEAQIIKHYHVIEKGLSMPDFRPRFGAPRVGHLIVWMERFLREGGRVENRHYGSSVSCLQAYLDAHRKLGVDVEDIITQQRVDELRSGVGYEELRVVGGVEEVDVEAFFASSDAPYFEFASSRRSCRVFDVGRAVSKKLISEAVNSAIRTPSVCNRQAWRVHSFHDREAIDRLLQYQNGNVGFGHQIPCLLVVTMELKCFDGVIERYQPWIDGGMFAMSLLLALHHLKLGAVPLNWSALPSADRGIREAGSIPKSESVIMLIGVGFPSGKITLPLSQRRLVDEVLREH